MFSSLIPFKKKQKNVKIDNLKNNDAGAGFGFGQNALFQPKQDPTNAESSMTRELFKVPMPTQTDAMTDLIKSHQSGDNFQYVSITGKLDEDTDTRLARLRNFKPKLGKRTLEPIRVRGIPMSGLEATMNVSRLQTFIDFEHLNGKDKKEAKKMSQVKVKFSKPYLQVTQITGLYTPLMSSTSNYTNFTLALIDNRLLGTGKVVQGVKMVTNQEGPIEVSCDYCIPTRDVECLELQYVLERGILEEDYQWGSMALEIRIIESDHPFTSPKRDAMGMMRMPFTTLEKKVVDPDFKDLSFTGNDLTSLRELYMRGEIVDVDEPAASRLRANSYSKSTLRSGPKGEQLMQVVPKGYEFMQNARKPKVDAMVASVSAQSEDEESTKSFVLESRAQWEAEQEQRRQELEEMRKEQGNINQHTIGEGGSSIGQTLTGVAQKTPSVDSIIRDLQSESSSSEYKRTKAKRVGFNVEAV